MSNPIFQTLEDRDNADEVENWGPFICDIQSAWLGNGYYFWDFHIELGHWWGKERYGKDKYIICKALCDISPDRCWDLHSEGTHREEFIKALQLLIKHGVANKNKITVAQVIEYAKQNGFFNHEAIRVQGINTAKKSNKLEVGTRLLFLDTNRAAYYDVYPAIQVCLLSKKSLSMRNYHIVWPEMYIQQDLVF